MKEKLIDISKRFTETHRSLRSASAALREAYTVRTLYPGILLPPEPEDMYAGRMEEHFADNLPVDLSPQRASQIGYTMSVSQLRRLQSEYPARATEIQEIIDYWKTESTFVKLREEAPKEVRDYLLPPGTTVDELGYMRVSDRSRPLGSGFISGSYDTRTAGIIPDYAKLVRLGLPGLRAEIEARAAENKYSRDFYDACLYTLGTVDICLEWYSERFAEAGKKDMSDILNGLRFAAPDTYRGALQLVIVMTMLMRTFNYGRLDITLGGVLSKQLESGELDFEEAVAQTVGFYDIIAAFGKAFDSRVVIGGMGRPEPEKADRFALVAIEAVRRCHRVVPVLTLRLWNGQSEELYERALDAIAEGCIYPVLYNDEVYVPGLRKSMNLPLEDAMDYFPLGCGEMVLDHKSVGSPNSTMRFLKALEVTLHNGRDGADGAVIGVPTGEISELDTYEKLEGALFAQIRATVEREIKVHEWNRFRTSKDCAMVMHSMLMDDCIERGRSYFDGGVRYFGANSEGFGLTNTADSLAAIKKLVYDEKKYTLTELVRILDENFEGHDDARRDMLSADKFGNNSEAVDGIKTRLERFINDTYHEVGLSSGMAYYTVANVNPGGITIGPRVAASADGRPCGKPMALSNSPMPGMDKSGLTAMLLSCAKSPADNGGFVTNMNISRESLVNDREKISGAFKAYFRAGGQELNVNCFSKGDLEAALRDPERYQNLIVRVSGYSARFISLDAVTQKHIMERTLF